MNQPEPTTLEEWQSEDIQALQINWPATSETREIGVPLTREEIQDAAAKLAETITTIEELEAEKKAASERINLQIKEQEKAQHKLSSLILRGADTRPVPCVWLFEIAGRNDAGAFIRDPYYKTIIRQDTGEVIEVKPITVEDRQMGLPLETPQEEPLQEEPLFSLDGGLPPETKTLPDEECTQDILESCYDAGSAAAARGETENGNPYPTATRQNIAWDNGWKDNADDLTEAATD